VIFIYEGNKIPMPNAPLDSNMTTPPFDFMQPDYLLAPHTLYRIGGAARWAFLPRTFQEAESAYTWLLAERIPLLIMGGGSNMLIDDKGFPGAVLFTTELKATEDLGNHRYRLGAGIPLAELVRSVMLPNNYAGVGALTGIPGTLGGALFMNAGTVNGSICQFTETVRMLTPAGPETVLITPKLYSYRGQVFCDSEKVIVEAELAFAPSEKDENAIYHHYIQRRQETQPQGWCCGSVFKNPPNDHAGRLIEACGLKGTHLGGAVISEKHANFIMNDNNASFEDVFGLIQMVKGIIFERFGVKLEEEVRIIQA
jgi:UDP-N-acetylmuramate dehydrogenase